MKFFMKKRNIQKIAISFIVLILFNFVVPTYSRADIGGTLSAPVVSLLCVIFDALNGLMGQLIEGDVTIWDVYPDKDSKKANQYIEEHPYDGDDDLPVIIIDPVDLRGSYGVPNILYTPAKIFSGDVPALDINFFSTEEVADEDKNKSAVEHLKDVVASWYVALRNLAVVGLLSVLIYLAIRMIITSNNAEKAKYKQNIWDWLVAMCLIFFLHYIMAFTITVTESITEMIKADGQPGEEVYIAMLEKSAYDMTIGDLFNTSGTKVEDGAPTIVEDMSELEDIATDSFEIDEEESFATSLVGAARIQVEYENGIRKWGYLVLYIGLTIYTLMFTVTYLKRLVNMVFLTVIAPLVALTYPIDKAGDSKAQAFSFWLKEYVYNALLQPMHLLLYTLLVSSAISLAASNMLYAIIVLAFILPAEKIFRQMFNFKNSSTGESLGGFAGGMMAKQVLDTVARGGKRKPQGGDANKKPRTANNPSVKDPNAPKGVGSLDGNALLAGGEPALSTRGVDGAQDERVAEGQANVPVEGMPSGGLTDDQRNTRNYLQEMLAGDDLNDDQRIALQDELDYYNGLEAAGNRINVPAPSLAGINELSSNYVPAPNLAPGKLGLLRRMQSAVPTGIGNNRIIRGIGNVASKKYHEMGGGSGIAKSALKGAARGAVGLAGTAMGAAVGLGAGITTGNLDDMYKYGFAGAISGSAIGKNVNNRIDSVIHGDVGRTFAEGYYTPEEITKRDLDKKQKEFRNSYENRRYFRQAFQEKTEAQIDQVMDTAATFHRNGLNDLDRIKDAIKMQEELLIRQQQQNIANGTGETITDDQRTNAHNTAYTLAKVRATLGESGLDDQVKVKSRQEAIAKQLIAKGASEAQAKASAENAINFMRETIG